MQSIFVSLPRVIRQKVMGLSPDEASFARRGFRGAGEPAQLRLESIGATFLRGYHFALEESEPRALTAALGGVDVEVRGFAFEGAAMALALLDALTPWNRLRVQEFLRAGAEPHTYMVHVGAGWAWARLGKSVPRMLAQVDPLLGWLAVDGYGFHEGFFHGKRYIEQQALPGPRGYAGRAFDQGLGRSLWFVEGAGVERIIARVQGFPASRQPDLWSGIGLACTYAGGVGQAQLDRLRTAAGPLLPHMAQGAVFAARARQRAGNLTPHTELACGVICERTAAEAAALAESSLAALDVRDEDPPRFERWRQSIQQSFSPEKVAA